MQQLPNEPTDADVREAVEEMATGQDEVDSNFVNVLSRLRFFVEQNKRTKQWRWKLLAANGRSIAVSGESYHNKADCLDAVELVRAAASAEVREVEG